MAKPQFNPTRLLIVHAHPDDESLYTGHIIADRIAKKSEVMVLTLTRGERGKVKLAELKPLEGNFAAMGAFRRTELIEALKAFGPVKHAFAGTRAYLDSGMRINAFGKPIKPKNLDELALSAASNSVIADDVVKAILEFKPDAVLTYNRRGGFGHPDHKKAYEASAMAVREVARQTKRAPQFWVVAEPREKFDAEIGDAKTALIKKSALEAHASQVAVSAETYSVVPGKYVRYDRPERVRLAHPSSIAQFKPFLTFFWALPLGVIFGLFGTLIHLVRANDDSSTPIGLVVALAMTGSAALALRLLRGSRGALYVFSGALTATVFWMAQRQIGGEVFIPDQLLSNIWAYGSIGVCALVIIFPKIQAGAWRRSSRGHR